MTKSLRISIFVILAIAISAINIAADDSYWQQEVNYKIDVTIASDLRTISGRIDIEYINNSPDALDRLYLKAFPNAIQKDSYADQKRRWMNDYSFAALKPSQEGSLELTEINSQNRPYSSIAHDNTIYTVYLNNALAPGDTLRLSFNFKTVLPSPDNLRMGLRGNTSKAAYWYPQVCVYDRKMGWVNSQYIGWGETYGDFGDFDVTITAPDDQIVAATGVCINESEVLPDSLRQLYDIKNFFGSRTDWPKFNFDKQSNMTWHYVAESVNDFAFTYSNQFCIDSDSINGVEVVAYPLRHKARSWENAVLFGKQSIETFSDVMYPYKWPVMRICDAFSGMEYPMITNCSGGGPSPRFALLIYHEIGHQWFMGQVGSNQSDRPFLDEGFTTHIEHIAMEKYMGRDGNYDHFTNWYEKKFAPPTEDRDARGSRPLLLLMKQNYDKQMVFSYDQGEEYWPYRVSAYYKSAAMHYSLRSILGDSAYFEAMHQYCEKWFFKHPYEDDFVNSMEAATGMQLDQYFHQWFYTRHRVDYAFDGKSSKREDNIYQHHIKLKRPGKFVAPIDMAVVWEQGDTTFYTIAPEGMRYQKPGYVVLPEWPQFRRLNDKYECTITAQRNIKKVILDPYNLLMDIDRTNNSSGFGWPTELRLDNMFYDRTPVNQYALRVRPDFWYDIPNGTHVGVHAHGAYLETDKKFSLDFNVGARSGIALFDVEYQWPFITINSGMDVFGRAIYFGERWLITETFKIIKKPLYSRPDRDLFELSFNYHNVEERQQNRMTPLPSDFKEFLPDATWDIENTYYLNSKFKRLRTFRYGSYLLSTSYILGTYDDFKTTEAFLQAHYLAKLSLTSSQREYLCLKFQYFDCGGEPPSQFINHISRVNSITRFAESKLFRAPGTFPTDWENDFYLFNGVVRGYQDRAIYFTEAFSGSVELTLPKLPTNKMFKNLPAVGKFLSEMRLSLFGDGAFAEMEAKESSYRPPISLSETNENLSVKILYAAAGVSLSFPPVWSQHQVRIDFPLYLNKPAFDEEEFEFRFSVAWILPTDF